MSEDNNAYLRYPTLFEDNVVFVCEDDLWTVALAGGTARRLTNSPGIVAFPHFSCDGKWLAYSAADDGSFEVFVIPAPGGEARRLTFHPQPCTTLGWLPGTDKVVFRSSLQSPQPRQEFLYSVARQGGLWQNMQLGPATAIAFSEDNDHAVLQRGYPDPAIWKRYRGGRCGQLWYGSLSTKNFQCLSKPQTVEASPFVYQNRIYFVSDADGTGNIYSYCSDGSDRRRHTFHDDFYVRWPSHHRGIVVYQKAGSLWKLDLESGEDQELDIKLQSCGYWSRKRFVPPSKYLHGYSLSPQNDQIIINSRGQLLVTRLWHGAVKKLGPGSGVRHKLCRWLADNKRIAAVSDSDGEEQVVIYDVVKQEICQRLGKIGTGGHIQQVLPAPRGEKLALAVASDLYIVSLDIGEVKLVSRANHRYFREFSWSPDGRWLAYAKFEGEFSYASIYVYDTQTETSTRVTEEHAHDYCPCFDPKGRYLYFLSKRVFNPYQDSLQNEYNFPATARPYLIVLQANRYSPFSSMGALDEGDDDNDKKSEKSKAPVKVEIDLDGIETRIQEIPIKEGRYSSLSAIDDKIMVLDKPVAGELSEPAYWQDPVKTNQRLVAYDLKERKEKVLAKRITGYGHTPAAKKAVLQVGYRLRIVTAGEEVKEDHDYKTGKESGWFDFQRIKVQVDPRAEWRQMLHEGWRWQRDFYWREDMHGQDWQKIWEQYAPLLAKVRSRHDLNDLFWELYGELGTSHAYAVAGEYPAVPVYRVGTLGVDFEFDSASGKYRLLRIYQGDPSHRRKCSPFLAPGVGVATGDYLLAINGEEPDKEHPPQEYLHNLAGNEILIKVATSPDGQGTREVTIPTLASDLPVRYHQWVKDKRNYVNTRTDGKIGYLHIPDMAVAGLINFHRDFFWQFNKNGMIVDLRGNAGGHVSQILLAKLQREVLGYCQPRRGSLETYPYQSIDGPIVALCDEYTGSDGDIFCQAFKDLRLGVLIGKRTWGGVVGIICDKRLVDGGLLTQPEFAFWFKSRGWDVENHGVEPDIEIDNTPDDYSQGRDPQLDAAIAEILQQLVQYRQRLPQ